MNVKRWYGYLPILSLLTIAGPVFAQKQAAVMLGDSLSGNFNPAWVDTVLEHLSLTGWQMKPGQSFDQSRNRMIPWIIPLGGLSGAGALTYLLLDKKTKTADCSINASTMTTSSRCGLPNGSASILLPIPEEYDISWSNGSSAATIQQVPAGTYSAVVRRIGTECTKALSVTIENLNPDFDASISTSPANCGLADGSATVTVSPGGSYQFSWSTGPEGPSLVNVRAGIYGVTVSAGGTCSKTFEARIDELPPAFSIEVSQSPSTCGASTGSANARVLPDGEYTYLWSNGASTPQVTGLAAGEYVIMVSLPATQCQRMERVLVEERPAEINLEITPVPGTCTGGGDLILTLGMTGSGPFVASIDGPAGQADLTLPGGHSSLSTSLNILPGEYSLMVYEMASGMRCAETFMVQVPDITPILKAIDDSYESPYGRTVSGNLLENDTGWYPELIVLMQAEGGLIEFTKDGHFLYTPDEGFSGSVAYRYQIRDTCGTTDSAVLNIQIAPALCDFTVHFLNTKASCGKADGSASIIVDSPGIFQFKWNDGQSGAQATGLFSGAYTVTVREAGTGCELVFDTKVEMENPQYFLNSTIIQPTCNVPGDILFEPSQAGGPSFELEVVHPGGQNRYQVPAGTVLVYLSSYLSIYPGQYTLKIKDLKDTASCTDVFTADIKAAEIPLIQKGPVVPPSSPSSPNGSITVNITKPGKAPFRIRINQADWGTTSQNSFKIQGLGAGLYRIQIQDANQCLSNILEVELGFTGLKSIEVGIGLSAAGTPRPMQSERTIHKSGFNTGPIISVAASFRLFGIFQESNAAWQGYPGWARIRMSQLFQWFDFRTRDIRFHTSSGLSLDLRNDISPELSFLLKGGITKKIGRWHTVSATVSLSAYLDASLNAGIDKNRTFFSKFQQAWEPAFNLEVKRKIIIDLPR